MAEDSVSRVINMQARLNVVAESNTKEFLASLTKQIEDATKIKQDLENTISTTTSISKGELSAEGISASKTEGGKEDNKDRAERRKALQTLSTGMENIAGAGIGILKSTLGIVTSVFERIKKASPLLEAVESLFNLAMQLFFMPLGTKLATVLIPSIIELIDGVMGIWEGFEDKTLGEILADTISMGAQIFGEYFQNIGETLAEEGGVIGAIGELLITLGDFIEKHGEALVLNIVKIIEFITDNLFNIIGVIVTLLVASKAIQIAQLMATLASAGWVGLIVGLITLLVGGLVAGKSGDWAKNMLTAADGGYFPASPGGTPVLIAEGGEGETVVPDSKKVDFATATLNGYTPSTSKTTKTSSSSSGGNTYNIYVNGYTDTDLEDKIVRVLNEQTNLSRLRSGF